MDYQEVDYQADILGFDANELTVRSTAGPRIGLDLLPLSVAHSGAPLFFSALRLHRARCSYILDT